MIRCLKASLIVAALGGVLVLPRPAAATPRTDMYTNVGLLGVTITNLGYIGHAFTYRNQPSGEYVLNSNTEHIYRGGLWVGARTPAGELRVTTGAQDANGLVEGDEVREFVDYLSTEFPEYQVSQWSNSQNSDIYNENALATQQINCWFNDVDTRIESGSHEPLGLHVAMRTLAWSDISSDDFIIIDYTIVNISGGELRDIYLGLWCDTSVGNTELRDPYDPQAINRWNYYDDYNGAWGAEGHVPEEYTVAGDPDIWMAYERDDDGDEGLATSWIGYRLLGTTPEADPPEGMPPVSYNAWGFRNVPDQDSWYYEEGDSTALLPGKYQLMSNGEFDVGETQEEDFTRAGNWVSIISTGPFPRLAADDTMRMTWAIVAGPDSLGLLSNSKKAQLAYNEGLSVASGPPSPILEFGYRDDAMVLRWVPGDSVDANGVELPKDAPERSPEYHINEKSNKLDFQGYRIYRHQGLDVSEEPYDLAVLVAEFDKIDGRSFDTGLPPLNEDGLREFVDEDLLEGFPYWYSVVSFSLQDTEDGLDAYQSGFNENAQRVYPGPAASDADNPRTVGVYPNPYRAGALYEGRLGEQEFNRRIWFTGLPARATIQIFTLNGDLVDTVEHDDPAAGKAYWDVLSSYQRAIASGLYIYAVKDHATGDVQRGKLVIIK